MQTDTPRRRAVYICAGMTADGQRHDRSAPVERVVGRIRQRGGYIFSQRVYPVFRSMAVGIQTPAADQKILMRTVKTVIPAVVPGRINEITSASDRDHVPAVVDLIASDKIRLYVQFFHKIVKSKGIPLTDCGSFHQGVIGIITGQGVIIVCMRDQPVMDIQDLLLLIPAAVNTGEHSSRLLFESREIPVRIIAYISRIESRYIPADTGIFVFRIYVRRNTARCH